MGNPDGIDDLTEDERVAVEEMERGLERVRRAHGDLLAFHHGIGSAMDHFEEARRLLDGDHDDIVDRLEEEVLPAGVTADGKLTYELVAEFEDGFLETVESTAEQTFEELADGERYAIERREFGTDEED